MTFIEIIEKKKYPFKKWKYSNCSVQIKIYIKGLLTVRSKMSKDVPHQKNILVILHGANTVFFIIFLNLRIHIICQ